MEEISPILLSVQPWDVSKGTSVYFNYTGSKQSLENELVITDVETSSIVYSYLYSTFEKVHHIPPNILTNGRVYKAKLRIKLSDGTFTPYSNETIFKTFANPVLDIDNIDGQGYVYNSDVTFIARYSQSDGESVKTYRFSLYDENEDLIESFPLRKGGADGVLTETISGLMKGKGYFIQCEIETVNGVVWSQRERFIPLYIVPSLNGLISTANDSEEGFVRVTANLKQITGTSVGGGSKDGLNSSEESASKLDNYQYIDNNWIIVPSNNPLIFRGLEMNKASDFIMKVWCRDIPNGKKFLDISPPANDGIAIEFWKEKDRIVAIKRMGDITSRYTSNKVTIPNSVEFMLYVKVIEHRIDLEIVLT